MMLSRVRPALLTRMSMRAERLLHRGDERASPTRCRATSQANPRASGAICAATACAFPASRPTTATRAPHSGQRLGDGATDAARTSGDERNASREIDLHQATLREQLFDFGGGAAGRSLRPTGAIFFTSPVRTLPGPISTYSASG